MDADGQAAMPGLHTVHITDAVFEEHPESYISRAASLGFDVRSMMDRGMRDRFSPYNVSFLADDILAMRYIELEGQLRTVLSVIKMRGSEHSRELRTAGVTSHGIEIRQELSGYRGIITGVPEPRLEVGSGDSGAGGRTDYSAELTPEAELTLDPLLRLGESSANEVAESTGLTLDLVVRVLEQLSATQWVIASERGAQPVYRAARRPL